MKVKILLMMFAITTAFLLTSCDSALNPLTGKNAPTLFPIRQNDKWGYINKKGEVVIQPQFEGHLGTSIGFFSESLAVACIESQKLGYIDKTGKFTINPQFDAGGMLGSFSEGLAVVRVGDKHGFIDKAGIIVINPQFDGAGSFNEGLATVGVGGKTGFIDKEGKLVVNPQFDVAFPFINGLAAVQIGKQFGYIDKTGKIVINPQFDLALPFSEEGLAMISVGEKVGFVNKEGKYTINPQFGLESYSAGMTSVMLFEDISGYGRASFSEGLAPFKLVIVLAILIKQEKFL